MKPNFYKLVKPLVAAAAILVAPAFVFAQQIIGFDAELSGGTYHVGTDATNGVNSLTVSNDDIAVTLDPGQFIRLNSTGKKEVTLSSSEGLTISTECTSDEYIIRIDVPSAGSQRTFTITPSSTTCTTGGSSTSGTSTGGGGGGPIRISSLEPTPTPAAEPTPAPAPAQAQAAPAVSAVFSTDLAFGSRGDDVARLQQLLASDKSIYPEGLVTGYFGNLTVKAVRAFQAKYGIPTVGRVGPQTRAKLAEIFGAGQPPAAVPTPAAPPAVGLTRELDPGARGDDVKALQEFLAKDKDIYPEGLVTGYYGPATANAVRRFQTKYGIPAVGRVGPTTLKKLQEVMGVAPAPAASVPVQTPAPASTPGLTPDPATQQPFRACTPNCP